MSNKVRVFPQRAYRERRLWLDGIKVQAGCKDCGLTGPAEALTFDHVRGEKRFGIGSSWNQGRQALIDEIAKCEIVCANCHNVRTKRRLRDDDGPEFVPFPKVARLNREVVISEKIDGTNGTVWVDGEGDVWAGSRTKWLTQIDDNFGFARWVAEHAAEFFEMGPCVIRGEWFGLGIQRGYGLSEKRFAVFNPEQDVPACCHVVPILARCNGADLNAIVAECVEDLRANGSRAVPGFMKPEGVVAFHAASKQLLKVTLEKDSEWKGKATSEMGPVVA